MIFCCQWCSLPDKRCDTKRTIPEITKIVRCHIHGGVGCSSWVDRLSSFIMYFHDCSFPVRRRCDANAPFRTAKKASPKAVRRMPLYLLFLLFLSRCGGAILSDPRKVRSVTKNGGGSYHNIESAEKAAVSGAPMAHRATCTRDGYGKCGRGIR